MNKSAKTVSAIAALAAAALCAFGAQEEIPMRQVWYCVDAGASDATRLLRDSLADHPTPLFRALAATHALGDSIARDDFVAFPKIPKHDARERVWERQAFNHLVLVGLPTDGPAMERTKGFTYAIDVEKREVYRLGFGRFRGDIGVVETTFNPYLYSEQIHDNPFSTLLVRITGTTQRGIELAAEAFRSGLCNGIVLGPDAVRAETSILDREPDGAPATKFPQSLPDGNGGTLEFAGWMQAPENDYRAYLDWGAKEQPASIERVKYFSRGALDTSGPAAWVNAPFPMAWGNAVNVVRFASEDDAEAVFAMVRRETRDATDSEVAGIAAFAVPFPKDEAQSVPGRTVFFRKGAVLVLSSLPDAANAELARAIP